MNIAPACPTWADSSMQQSIQLDFTKTQQASQMVKHFNEVIPNEH